MFITLLCIAFASDLSFEGLTLQALFQWYCLHPFLFIFALMEIVECACAKVEINK